MHPNKSKRSEAMQIVINISEEDYMRLKRKDALNEMFLNHYEKLIVHGKPLPKGHGKIVDIGKIEEDRIEKDNPIIYLQMNGDYTEAVSLDYLNNLPVLVEADSVGSDDGV